MIFWFISIWTSRAPQPTTIRYKTHRYSFTPLQKECISIQRTYYGKQTLALKPSPSLSESLLQFSVCFDHWILPDPLTSRRLTLQLRGTSRRQASFSLTLLLLSICKWLAMVTIARLRGYIVRAQMHSCKSGCMNANMDVLVPLSSVFWSFSFAPCWHFPCFPISKRIIAAERWEGSNLKASHFPVSNQIEFTVGNVSVSLRRTVLKMSTRTGSKKEGLFKTQKWQAKWHASLFPPSSNPPFIAA